MKHLVLLCSLVIAAVASGAAAGEQSPKLVLKDGDRVAFIGNTFVEREQDGCYIETMLTSRFPNANVTFRNLGYSADTVTGSARGLCVGWSAFETPDKAFDRLRKLVAEYKPTVLLMNYGMTESFTGPEGLPTFVANYNKMLDALSAAAGTSPRIVLMSPNYHEDLGRPLPDPAEHNKNLKLYSDAISGIASKRGSQYIDLFSITNGVQGTPLKLTSNGIHLTPWGYWLTARTLEVALGYDDLRSTGVRLNAKGTSELAKGAKVSNIEVTANGLNFVAQSELLPTPPMPLDAPVKPDPTALDITNVRNIAIGGLKPGKYQLTAGGAIIATGSAEDWDRGVQLRVGPDVDQAETLRKLIVAKNFDYFAYQRPDNDSYILAFRKHEQGKNAVELPQFLPLVEEKEKQIAALRVPKPVTYTLMAVK